MQEVLSLLLMINFSLVWVHGAQLMGKRENDVYGCPRSWITWYKIVIAILQAADNGDLIEKWKPAIEGAEICVRQFNSLEKWR